MFVPDTFGPACPFWVIFIITVRRVFLYPYSYGRNFKVYSRSVAHGLIGSQTLLGVLGKPYPLSPGKKCGYTHCFVHTCKRFFSLQLGSQVRSPFPKWQVKDDVKRRQWRSGRSWWGAEVKQSKWLQFGIWGQWSSPSNGLGIQQKTRIGIKDLKQWDGRILREDSVGRQVGPLTVHLRLSVRCTQN